MDNLRTLIRSLSSGEEKLIRHFYKLRDFGEYRKRVQLLDLVMQGKASDENSLAKMMGYPSLNASYHNIKSRLKSDIVCVLLMQESSCKFNTQYAQAMFSCRRALLTGEILLSRGVYQEGVALLKKAARLAEKFELYAERIITEDALRNHYAGSNDVDELNSGTDAIDDNYRLLGQMMDSKKKLYQTVFPLSGAFDEDAPHYGSREMLTELEELESNSDSSRVGFYSKLSRLNILHSNGDLKNAIECAHGLLRDVEKDPVIMSAANQAGIHLEISNMYLRTHDFVNADLHAVKAAELFKPGMLNHMRACTLRFYSQVHSGQFDAADETLNGVLGSRCLKEPQYEVLRQRIYLVGTWFSFARGKMDVAFASFRNCSGLTREKGAWFYGYSLMESMILIEKKSYEAAMYKLDALRKSIARGKKDSAVVRTLLAITVLRHLVRCDNNYKEMSQIASEELNRLGAPLEETTWDPTGFEIIPLDQLMRMRMTRAHKPV